MSFLNIPVLNAWKRLLRRWITPPKIDFWPCWIGMLLPVCISVWYILFDWKLLIQKPWFSWLAFFWLWSVAAFTFRWLTAPKWKEHVKSFVVASFVNRSLTFLAFILVNAKYLPYFAIFLISMFWFGACSMLENAYERAVARLTPEGIAEYEALQGSKISC